MSDEINSIKTYRQELLNQCVPNITSIPQTGYSGIDAIISFMTKEAAADNINLKFNFDGTFLIQYIPPQMNWILFTFFQIYWKMQ